tara:strand:- start:11206 stop:11691 length:486 start_codon:yes stop_codon:yes gene_type:complete
MQTQLNRSSSIDRSSPTSVMHTDSATKIKNPTMTFEKHEIQNADVAESLESSSRVRKTEKQHADLYKFMTWYEYQDKFYKDDPNVIEKDAIGLPLESVEINTKNRRLPKETVGLPTKDTKRRLPKETDGTASSTQTKEPTAKKVRSNDSIVDADLLEITYL